MFFQSIKEITLFFEFFFTFYRHFLPSGLVKIKSQFLKLYKFGGIIILMYLNFLSSINLGEEKYEQKTYQTQPNRNKRKNEK